METQEITRGRLIKAGNHLVSIGTLKVEDVAIISKHTGEFARIGNAGKKLKRIKRKFKTWLNSDETFTFSFMTPETTIELIKTLKAR